MKQQQQLSKPHILAVPFPAQGHLSPLLHLCKALVAHGFTISFVNVDSIHELMVKNWRQDEEGPDLRLELLDFHWKIPQGFDAYCMSNLPEFFDSASALAGSLGCLVEKLSKEVSPVLAIISDYFLPWTQDVADKLGIPRIVFWSGNAAWTAVEYYAPDLIARGKVPVTEEDLLHGEPIDWIPGISPVKPVDLPVYMRVDNKRWTQITLERAPVVLRGSTVLVNSFYELEPETLNAMANVLGDKLVAIGPILLQDYLQKTTSPVNVVLRSEDKKCIEWLNAREESSVLYISFGSIAVLTSEQFQQLAEALEALNQPFLWVIRPELVVGKGHEAKYEGFCQRTKEQGYISPWAPQLRVLEHPSVGGFLTHCGWNSMLESMCNGVPMIGWPWAAEQNYNCKLMVEDWKLGTTFAKGPTGLYEKDEIQRVINMLMNEAEGKRLKAKVDEVKCQARKAVAPGGASLKNFQAFFSELGSLKRGKA